VDRRPRILYLDQNAWIALARGAWDRTEHPRDHAALTVVADALNAGEIIVPLSFTNQYETMKINDPVRRAHLARVQVTVSAGRVLRSRRRILEVMLSRCIADVTGGQAPALCDDWFMSDLWFEAVAELASGAFDDIIPPMVVDHIQRYPQDTLLDYLVCADDAVRKESVRRFSSDSDALLARITARRQLVSGESFPLRLRVYSAHLLHDEIDNILTLGRRQGLPWSVLSDIGERLAKRLVTDVPIMNAERQLAVRLEDQPRAVSENDLRDMAAFVAAVPLVDIVVAEKQFVNLSRQAKLDTQYGVRLLTSVHDLTRDLIQSADGRPAAT
jgi:hypothetical protein